MCGLRDLIQAVFAYYFVPIFAGLPREVVVGRIVCCVRFGLDEVEVPPHDRVAVAGDVTHVPKLFCSMFVVVHPRGEVDIDDPEWDWSVGVGSGLASKLDGLDVALCVGVEGVGVGYIVVVYDRAGGYDCACFVGFWIVFVVWVVVVVEAPVGESVVKGSVSAVSV